MADNEFKLALEGVSAEDREMIMSGFSDDERSRIEANIASDDTQKVETVEPAKGVDEKPDANTAKEAADAKATKESTPPLAEEDDEPTIEVPDAKGTKQKAVSFGRFDRQRKKDAARIADLEKSLGDRDKNYAELKERFDRGDERLRLLAEAMTPKAEETEQEDVEPDPQTDIMAWASWAQREMGRLRDGAAQTTQAVTDDQADRNTRDAYQRDAVAFARETPDFGPAYNYLLQSRAAMLVEQGYNEQQVRQILFNEEKGLVERAAATGKRPAAMVYGLAKQLGWRPEMAQQAQNGAATPSNGAAPKANGGSAPAAPAASPKQPSVTEEVERIAAAAAASKSLSGAGGPASEMSLEALANMSAAEFSALYAKHGPQIDRLMGKPH